jgi:hypothetical protein
MQHLVESDGPGRPVSDVMCGIRPARGGANREAGVRACVRWSCRLGLGAAWPARSCACCCVLPLRCVACGREETETAADGCKVAAREQSNVTSTAANHKTTAAMRQSVGSACGHAFPRHFRITIHRCKHRSGRRRRPMAMTCTRASSCCPVPAGPCRACATSHTHTHSSPATPPGNAQMRSHCHRAA